MKRIILILFASFVSSCHSQKQKNEFTNEHLEVLKAFLNNKYDHKDSFYVNKNIKQQKYLINFRSNYKRYIEAYKSSDSICKNSTDTALLKLKCPIAFSLKKYQNLITEKDFNYLKKTYNEERKNDWKFNTNELKNYIPLLLNHSKDFYEVYNKDVVKARKSHREYPSLEISGIYFLEDQEIAIIAHSMIESHMGGGLAYSIMKKENGVWWRFVGSLQLSYV